ncbi:high frequency lysogenization protein HflD [Conservatibacter flavescens]|uniref:High frequency lysogenization protein HflD homolog n=1 Tax=Conservatibacter flavescens TaxID=28161 RepID=A0A2M8S3B3_9PAST|nr:high frequency lysogenization protein HflD [Conservatibacter flavescens]PJG85587.1 lysogenization regulator HflD [Conservatibacter flavescens]
MANYYDITLALAGVCQAAKLVHQFAHGDESDSLAFETSLNSLLVTSPESTLEVYGNEPRHLKLGLETVLEQLNAQKGNTDLEISRYWLSLLALEGKLNKSLETKNKLGQRIQYLPTQLSHYGLITSDNVLESLAGIYVDIISPLGNKIQVKGAPDLLQQPIIQHRIRASLLAGIRSAVLWRQVGGSKWQFLFSRRKLAEQAQRILSSF